MGNTIERNHDETLRCQIQSYPNNPNCKCNTDYCSHMCSENETKDLCCWHHTRMDRLVKVSCGCQEWTVVCGDATSRRLARKYYDIPYEEPCLASGALYCCGQCSNYDNDKWKCGDMYICPSCKNDHDGVNYNKKRNNYLPVLWLLLKSRNESHYLKLLPKEIIEMINRLSFYNVKFNNLIKCHDSDTDSD